MNSKKAYSNHLEGDTTPRTTKMSKVNQFSTEDIGDAVVGTTGSHFLNVGPTTHRTIGTLLQCNVTLP